MQEIIEDAYYGYKERPDASGARKTNQDLRKA